MKFSALTFLFVPLMLASCQTPTPATDAGKTAAAPDTAPAPSRQIVTGSRLGVDKSMSSSAVKSGDASAAKGILGAPGQGSNSAVVP